MDWIFGPSTRCIQFIGEETKNGGLLKRALAHLELDGPLWGLARERLESTGQTAALESLDRVAAQSPWNEQWAVEIRTDDYAAINAHSLVAVWGALEICVEDTVAALLRHDPDAGQILLSAGVSAKFIDRGMTADEEIDRTFRRLEQTLAIRGDAIATYERLLNVFGLSARLEKDQHVILLKAGAVRNCIVHRGGLIDTRAATQVPLLEPMIGQTYRVSSEEYLQVHSAAGSFATNLIRSIVASPYVKMPISPSAGDQLQ